jgi:urease beta subunit
MANLEYLAAKGRMVASSATLAELEDMLRFLPGMAEDIVLRVEFASGHPVAAVRIEPGDEQFMETVLIGLYNLVRRRVSLAEKVVSMTPKE